MSLQNHLKDLLSTHDVWQETEAINELLFKE